MLIVIRSYKFYQNAHLLEIFNYSEIVMSNQKIRNDLNQCSIRNLHWILISLFEECLTHSYYEHHLLFAISN